MLNNFVIALREGFEGALIVSILASYLVKSGRIHLRKSLWAGVFSAIVLSLAVGAILTYTSSKLSHEGEAIFAGLTSLTAVGLVTWMVFWMKRIARSIRGELEERASIAISAGAMALTAFASVAREGIETSLFVYTSFNVVGTAFTSLFGLLLGFAAAIALGVGVYKGSLHLNMRLFFAISGSALILVAGNVLYNGIGDLQEVGWLPGATFFDATLLIAYLVATLPAYLYSPKALIKK